jgi:hypothetical protein
MATPVRVVFAARSCSIIVKEKVDPTVRVPDVPE